MHISILHEKKQIIEAKPTAYAKSLAKTFTVVKFLAQIFVKTARAHNSTTFE